MLKLDRVMAPEKFNTKLYTTFFKIIEKKPSIITENCDKPDRFLKAFYTLLLYYRSNYEKDEVIIKLIDLVIDKFKEMKENTLVKCFNWAQKILQENLEIKIDSSTFKNLEKMKEKKPSLKIKLGWFE